MKLPFNLINLRFAVHTTQLAPKKKELKNDGSSQR